MSGVSCWKSTINSSQSLGRLMSWKLPYSLSGKSCQKNTSTRRWRTSPSVLLPTWLWLPMVVTSSICVSIDVQVCILISSPSNRLFLQPPTDNWWSLRSERWEWKVWPSHRHTIKSRLKKYSFVISRYISTNLGCKVYISLLNSYVKFLQKCTHCWNINESVESHNKATFLCLPWQMILYKF